MIYKPILLFILFLLLKIDIGKTYNVNSITYVNDKRNAQIYQVYINEFNKYSIKNNLNVTLNLILLTSDNSTVGMTDFENSIEYLVNRNSTKYDLYIYDNVFTHKLGKHFLSLEEYSFNDTLDLYRSGIAPLVSIYKGKWVSIPVKIDVSVLYYNNLFLEKYRKSVPKTWKELYETGKYILNKEKKLGNTDFSVYNGLFPDTEIGMCSFYEMIYSFRNDITSDFPQIDSNEVRKSLEFIKKLKIVFDRDERRKFQEEDSLTFKRFESGNFLFQKYWYTPIISGYDFVPLPGSKEGISGSVLGGLNLAINKYINKEQRESALKVLKFVASKDMQKKVLIKYKHLSAISDLYKDKEVCKSINCDNFENLQIVARPIELTKDYTDYSRRFRKHILNYLYNNKTLEETVENIDDLTKIYTISLKSTVGIINTIIVNIFSFIMIFSIILLYLNKFKKYFDYLPNDFWIMIIIGSLIILHSLDTEFTELTKLKCHLRMTLLNIGLTLSTAPILYKLIVNFPERNKYSLYINNNRYVFFFGILLIELVLDAVYYLTEYKLVNVENYNGKIFRTCRVEKSFTIVMLFLIILVKVFIYLIIMFLIFIEWNLRESISEMKYLLSAVSIDIMCFVIFFVLMSSRIQYSNYYSYYIINTILTLSLSLSNYLFLFGVKILKARSKLRKRNRENNLSILYYQNNLHRNMELKNRTSSRSRSNTNSNIASSISNSSDGSSNHSLIRKVLNYHNKDSIDDISYSTSSITYPTV